MAESENQSQIAEQLRLRLAEQDELRSRFDAASPANDFKEEIGLEEKYRPVTEFRMDRTAFIVQHVPTTLLNLWPAMMDREA